MSDGLPPGWSRATLPELVGKRGLLSDGDWVESKDQDPDGAVRLTQLADVGDGTFRDRSNRFLTPARAEALRCTFLEPGDLLIARLPDPLGRACQFPGSPQPCITVVDVCIARPGDDGISPRWLMHAWNSPQMRRMIDERKSGSTRLRISKKRLSEIQIPVPPSSEQRRISDELDTQVSRLDATLTTVERLQANLKRYRASVLQAAVEGRLVPTEAEIARRENRDYEPASVLLERMLRERRRRWEEDELARLRAKGKEPKGDRWKAKYNEPVAPDTQGLPGLPEGWCWASVEQMSSPRDRAIQSGPFGSNLRHSEFQPTGRLVVGIDNVQDGWFSMGSEHRISLAKFDELQRYEARPLDLLVTVMATVGRCCLVPEGLEPAIITKHVYRVTLEQGLVLPRYACLVVSAAPAVRRQMVSKSQGQTRPGLNGTLLKQLVVPLPPRREQDRLADVIEMHLSVRGSMLGTCEAIRTRVTRLRQSVLASAFRGHLVDQDPSDEPASVLLERIRKQRETDAAKKSRRGRSKKTS